MNKVAFSRKFPARIAIAPLAIFFLIVSSISTGATPNDASGTKSILIQSIQADLAAQQPQPAAKPAIRKNAKRKTRNNQFALPKKMKIIPGAGFIQSVAPAQAQAPVNPPAAKPMLTDAQLSSIEKAFTEADAEYLYNDKTCVDRLKSMKDNQDRLQNRADASNVGGYALTAGGIISTYHPVAAGLTALGALFTADSKSVRSVLSTDMDKVNSNYSSAQQMAKNAEDTYWKNYERAGSLLKSGGTPTDVVMILREASLRLQTACNNLGVNNVGSSPGKPSEDASAAK